MAARIQHVIPEKSSHRTGRRKPGSRSGHPVGFVKTRYQAWNQVERTIKTRKWFRAVAIRHDKRGCLHLGR